MPSCILPLPARKQSASQPPRVSEPEQKQGAPSIGSTTNPNSRLGASEPAFAGTGHGTPPRFAELRWDRCLEGSSRRACVSIRSGLRLRARQQRPRTALECIAATHRSLTISTFLTVCSSLDFMFHCSFPPSSHQLELTWQCPSARRLRHDPLDDTTPAPDRSAPLPASGNRHRRVQRTGEGRACGPAHRLRGRELHRALQRPT